MPLLPSEISQFPPRPVRLAILSACKRAVAVAPNHSSRTLHTLSHPCRRSSHPGPFGVAHAVSLQTQKTATHNHFAVSAQLHAADCIHVRTPCRHYGAWREQILRCLTTCPPSTSDIPKLKLRRRLCCMLTLSTAPCPSPVWCLCSARSDATPASTGPLMAMAAVLREGLQVSPHFNYRSGDVYAKPITLETRIQTSQSKMQDIYPPSCSSIVSRSRVECPCSTLISWCGLICREIFHLNGG